MPVFESPQVVEYGDNPASFGTPIGFAAQTAANHLHVAHGTEDSSGNQDQIGLRSIETRGEYTVIADDTDLTSLKSVEEVPAGGGRRVSADCR